MHQTCDRKRFHQYIYIFNYIYIDTFVYILIFMVCLSKVYMRIRLGQVCRHTRVSCNLDTTLKQCIKIILSFDSQFPIAVLHFLDGLPAALTNSC